MNKLLLAFSILVIAACPVANAQDRPPANYENWGVCPFECCQYRDWIANADIPVHVSRNDQSAVVFHLHNQEKLHAETGVVVTKKTAAVRIDKAVRDGYLEGIDEPQLALKAICLYTTLAAPPHDEKFC